MTTAWTKSSDGSTIWSRNTGNVANLASWTTATRPTSPNLFVGQTGLNTDFNGLETWNGTYWVILNGTWTVETRPTLLLGTGSRGFNSDLGGYETWNGQEWVTG